jgi:hypothetical protein
MLASAEAVAALIKAGSRSPSRRRAQATGRRYLRQAFSHPLNVSVLVVLSVFALAYGALPWLALGLLLELLGLSALLRTDFFRVRAEQQLQQAELAALRLSLDGTRLRELGRLEALAAAVQKSRASGGIAARLPEGLIERLLERYLRLSRAHQTGRDLLSQIDRHALEREIAMLASDLPRSSPAIRRLKERRLEMARRRVARLDLAVERVEVLEQELAAITETLHFLHEQALAPVDCVGDHDELDLERLLGDLGDHELALFELEAAAGPA